MHLSLRGPSQPSYWQISCLTGDSFGEASEIHEQEGWFGCVFGVDVGKLIVFRNSGIVFIMGV